MKAKFISVLLAVLVAATGAAFISGCSVNKNFILNIDEDGNKYYSVKCSGYAPALDGVLEIPETYGEGEDNAPVTHIEENAFRGTNVTEVVLPSSVKSIGMAAFANCYKLKKVTYKEGSAVTEISQGQFAFCRALEQIVLPANLKTIGVKAFTQCEHLVLPKLPESVTEIGALAFSECGFLESIILPQGLKTIGERAFYMAGLKELAVPESVVDKVETVENDKGEKETKTTYGLGVGAFWCCEQLKTVKIYGRVQTLPSSVFGYCPALEEIYLPDSIKTIEGARYVEGAFYCGHAFHNDPALKTVYYAGSAEQWAQVDIKDNVVTISGEKSDNTAILNAQKHFNAEY